MKTIYLRKAVVVLKNGQVEPIYRLPAQENKLRFSKYKKNKTDATCEETVEKCRQVRVSKTILLKPGCETVFMAHCDDSGPFFMQPDDRIY